jgi:hypothetical protein
VIDGGPDREIFMNKPVNELTDSQLDDVSGGIGGVVDPLALIVVANSTQSGPDLGVILNENQAVERNKLPLRGILRKSTVRLPRRAVMTCGRAAQRPAERTSG